MVRIGRVAGLLFLVGLGMACSGVLETEERPAPSDDEAVVARYADTAISRAELDSAFVASAGGPEAAADSSLSDYRAFLDRYLEFRLKVRAARDAGLDTLSSIQRDVRTYRQELARPPLLRTEVYEPLARTLYERRTQAVDVSHILVRIPSPQDTLSAYRRAQALADSVEQGVPFGALAYRNSDDPAARQEGQRGYRGRLGALRAGQIVEPFEKRMYELAPGETSGVFRTKFGYHILKVHGRRPATPPVELAHLLRRPQGDSAATRHFLDSLRTELLEGDPTFAAAARQYSQDSQSASKGGALGEVIPQALPPPLREAVASLDSVGAISPVVRSRFGYHLLQLKGRQEQPSFDEAYEELKRQVAGQPRAQRRKSTFAREIRTQVGATVDTTRLLALTDVASVDTLARPLFAYTDTASALSPAVATLGDSTYTVSQMVRHLTQTDGGAQTTLAGLIDSFLNEKAIQYVVVRKARRDPDLAQQMKTYREGALLFRYMQDSVWTAAAQDTAGLRALYRQNRPRYRVPERVRTITFRAPADSLLRPLRSTYDSSASVRATMKAAATDSLVSADTVYVTERSAEPYRPVWSMADGAAIGPTTEGDASMLLIRDARLPPRPQSFEEARSRVVQDHQEAYEQQLVRRLRERYDAESFPERLRLPISADSSARR
jgi:peptidyl-prolyl cis-trans isomerase SurA